MTGLFWNLLLATFWVFLTGSFDTLNYLFGMFVGYLVIGIIHRRVPALYGYPYRIPRVVSFLFYFLWEFLRSNVKVASDIVTPPWHMNPGVLRYDVTEARSDLELTMLANFISLTPGTLVLDISEDRKALFVHAMFMTSEEEVLADLQELEKRLLKVIR